MCHQLTPFSILLKIHPFSGAILRFHQTVPTNNLGRKRHCLVENPCHKVVLRLAQSALKVYDKEDHYLSSFHGHSAR